MKSNHSTPDSSSAVKSISSNDSPLAGTTAQTTPPPPAQDPSTQTLAKQIEIPKSKTLATESPSVPRQQDQPAVAPTTTELSQKDSDPSHGQCAGAPSSAELWKAKQKGKAPIKSLLPIVGKQNMVYKQVEAKESEPPVVPPSSSSKDPPPAWPALPSPLPTDMPPKNGRTVPVEHDLSMGSLSVDLQPR
ncbi:hypothetical protein F2Q69_00009049 [Brassica cretica]|uniref:Uncharacterized protein n=1 Tax=Brassica cretica TaxID=69181 RepID=A0A8S9PEV1_BRACR|nr:hypothetical protein F2Q69_00009049 [Brassica cretica]